MLEPGSILDNKYRIEAILGRGGFGCVYRARERLTGEAVAIKELVPGFVNDPELVQRFIQEARATLHLTHPHIARTYGVFEDRGTYYLAMEVLSGGSLADRLERGPLPVEQVVEIASTLCQALAYAHQRGVVHCDIKPANVLFDERGRVRLADFGIAHVSEQMMTRQFYTATGIAMGTVRYMAPEQLEGVREDPRIDIYATGAMMYEMLTGRPYLDFESESTPMAQMRNLQRIQSEPSQPLREVNPAVPAWLAGVVERALRKSPGERFATAGELEEALRQRTERPRERWERVPPPARPSPEDQARGGVAGWLGRLSVWGLVLGGGMVLGCLAVMVLLVGSGIIIEGVSGGSPASPSPATATPPRPTSTPEPTAAATSAPTGEASGPPVDNWTRPTDGMVTVYVPGGTFQMGSNVVDDEQPVHEVTLDGFSIDRTEVTKAQYAAFLNEEGNQSEGGARWLDLDGAGCRIEQSGGKFQPESGYADHPVVQVSWYGAAAYCEWAGSRLPTEAEWEYAARGEQGNKYPWGYQFDCAMGNFDDETAGNEDVIPGGEGCDGYQSTAPVGSFQDGATWCGALDMAGNVWEWVADWYDDGYYGSSPSQNPEGPTSGEERLMRGGSKGTADPDHVRGANRNWQSPDEMYSDVGFRCATDS